MRSRKTTDAERALFKDGIEQFRPKVVPKSRPRKSVSAKPGGSGLDGNTAEKLKRGQLVPGARIDLHGYTEDRAHDALLAFLRRAQNDGVKLALVITGKGNPVARASSPSATPSRAEGPARQWGILKEMAPRWLNEKSFAALIAGSGPAHRRHGGAGALYVYLRKKP